ncbi:MAG: DUF952 domain-containing protein [Mycobacterium sp.]
MDGTPNSHNKILVHLCLAEQWQAARDCVALRPDSLREHGFVHLSRPEQVHLPANRLFAGRTDLMLLCLDAARLSSPVRWAPGVPTDPDGLVFPHLYGPLPVAAVISVTRYLPDHHGLFAPWEG